MPLALGAEEAKCINDDMPWVAVSKLMIRISNGEPSGVNYLLPASVMMRRKTH